MGYGLANILYTGALEVLVAFAFSVTTRLRLIADPCVYDCCTTERTILAVGSKGVLLDCACSIYICWHPSHLGFALLLLEATF